MQVLIVDSSPLIVQRLEQILADATTITTIYSTVYYDHALTLFTDNEPDIVLLGISMQTYRPMKLLNEIKAAIADTTVIVLSTNTDEGIQQECTLSGADYFLDKYKDFERIPGIIDTIGSIN